MVYTPSIIRLTILNGLILAIVLTLDLDKRHSPRKGRLENGPYEPTQSGLCHVLVN